MYEEGYVEKAFLIVDDGELIEETFEITDEVKIVRENRQIDFFHKRLPSWFDRYVNPFCFRGFKSSTFERH